MKPSENAAQSPDPLTRIFRGLKSIRFAIILMALIAVACLVGTLIVQGSYNPEEAVAHYGPKLGLLVGLLGLNHLYGAWWFVGLLFLLALSIATCSFSGLRLTFRKICTLIAHASILLIVAGAILRAVASVNGYATVEKGETTDVLHVAVPVLVDYRYAGPRGEQGVEKESHELTISGPTFLNFPNVVAESIVVRDAGGTKTYKPNADYGAVEMADEKGLLYTGIQYPQPSPIGAVPLGFKVRLDDFVIRYYDNIEESLAVRLEVSGQTLSIPIEVGKVVPLSDGTTIEVVKRVLNFKLNDSGQLSSESEEPANPAVQVRLTRQSVEFKRWVFALHPEFQGHTPDAFANIQLKYIYRPATIKSFESHVTVLDNSGKEVQKAVVMVNSPLKVGRFTFYQSGYNPRTKASTTLQVASDPGVWLVFAGFLLLPIGIALTIYGRPLFNRKGRSGV